MAVKISYRNQVRDALKELCTNAPSPGEILFRTYFTTQAVATKAGCSTTTARKYLDELSRCLGYSKQRIYGQFGYRFDSDI